jgi:oligoendopeptidase F
MKDIISVILVCFTPVCFGQKYFETREEIPEKYKWDLTELCTDSLTWAREYTTIEQFIADFSKTKMEIPNAETLYNIQYQRDSIYNEFMRLYLYAMMLEHLNQNEKSAQAMRINMDNLENNYFDATAWLKPAILSINEDSVNQWFLSNNKLSAYKFEYKNLIREKEHVLDEEKEQLTNLFSNAKASISGVYDELFYSDLGYPTIELEGGQSIELNSTTYNKILRENDRKLRIKAYKAKSYFFTSKKNTCAALLSSNCQMIYAYALAHGYKTSLQMDIFSDSIPESVYTGMVETMKENTGPLKKYHRLRARVLKIDDYQSADMSCPTIDADNKYNYEDARTIMREALQPMGEEYIKNLDVMLNKRRIDVYESAGKISTVAYSVSVYGISPYILTTYGGKQNDMYDLIHELGHSVHAMLSMQNQPLSEYEPSIFKDEISSTINELFLTDYLIKKAESPQDKLLVLQTAIESMSYYYNCALKADFAYQLYSAIENEEPVTSDYLDELYSGIHDSFYGNSILNVDAGNWTKFGMVDFYDFKYVTSMTAALIFHNRIISGSKLELAQYMDFLKSGGNDYPLAQLSKAGIDMSDKTVYKVIAEYTGTLVSMYEEEIKKLGLIE